MSESENGGAAAGGILPEEYRFDVAKATASLTALAVREPDAPTVLTLARWGDAGLEDESEVRLRAEEAAALLATVSPDQRLRAGGNDLVVLRIGREDDRWGRGERATGPE